MSVSFLASAPFFLSTLVYAACSFDVKNELSPQSDGGNSRPDSADTGTGGGPHLLISEVKNRDNGSEFIEIFNPLEVAISLDDYYLADNGAYVQLPGMIRDPQMITIPERKSDFVVRFPPGHSIASKAVVVIGIQATQAKLNFDNAQFNIRKPSNDDPGVEMIEAYPGSIRNDPGLTDKGEGIALFYWDGETNLVRDVDLVLVGDNVSAKNQLPNKTDVLVVPSGGTGLTRYREDKMTIDEFQDRLTGGESYQRTSLVEIAEGQDGIGNGITGHDETTEDTSLSWGIAEATPGISALASQ